MTEETLFAQALELPPEKRLAFLDEACDDDAELRERIEVLLRSHDQVDSFLSKPAEEEFDATLDISVDDQALIESRSAELRKSHAEKKPEEHEPPSVNIIVEPGGKKVMYFGDYELQGEIARGAMGVVYRAEQKSLKRTVAIKMIRSTMLTNEVDVSRFKAESEAAASLDHPNIVPIYEVGMHEDQHYFTMKLIEGGTLRDHLGRLKEDPKAAAKLMSSVAGAIHAAHQRSILHRDLKPGNILIDEDGAPHVTDFGLAKQMESNSSVTLSGQIMGTPQYMAPEQAEGGGKELTTAADIYGLGAMFYEMLCGKPPHQGESLMETLKLVAEEEALPPSRHHAKIDRDLETIAMKCLEKEPGKRYASAQGLKNDLDRWLAGEPILARPVGTAEKAFKWMKRKPMHAAAAVLAVLFLLTLGIGGPMAALRQAELREEATTALGKSQVALAEGAYLSGDGQRALKYLQLCPEEVRDTHWDYLHRHADEALFRLPQREGNYRGVVVDPRESGQFFTLEQHGGIRRIDGRSGEVLEKLDFEIGVSKLVITPNGEKLAVVDRFGRSGIGIYSTAPLDEVARFPFPAGVSKIFSAAFSRDNRILAIGVGSGTVLLDVETGEETRISGFTVKCADPKGNGLYGLRGKVLLLLEPTSGRTTPVLELERSGSRGLDVSPDGAHVAVGYSDGTISFHEIESKRHLKTVTAHATQTYDVRFSRSGSCLLSFGIDNRHGSFRLWEIATGARRPLRTIFSRESGSDTAIAWDESSRLLLTGLSELSATLMPADFSVRVHRRMGNSTVRFVDGETLAFSHTMTEGVPQLGLFDLREGRMKEVMPDFSDAIRSRTRDHVIAAWADYTTNNRTVNLPALVAKSPRDPVPFSFRCIDAVAVAPSGRFVAAASPEYLEAVEYLPSGEWKSLLRRRESENGIPSRTKLHQTVLFFPETDVPTLVATFLVQGEETDYRIYQQYDLSSGELIVEKRDPVAATCLLLDPSGRWLLAGTPDGTVIGKDARTLEDRFSVRVHDRAVTALAIRPDGEVLATGENDGLIRLWKMEDGRPAGLLLEMTGSAGRVSSLDFSPSGGELVSQSLGGIRKYEIGEVEGLPEEDSSPGKSPSESLLTEHEVPDTASQIEAETEEPVELPVESEEMSGLDLATLLEAGDRVWTDPVPVEVDSPVDRDEHYEPFLSADGRHLYLSVWNEGGLSDVFRFDRSRDSLRISNAYLLPGPINSEQRENGISMTADGRIVAVARGRDFMKGGFHLDLLRRDPGGVYVSDPVLAKIEFGETGTDSVTRGPTLTADGLCLVFTSKRKGTMGGPDIWMATRKSLADAFDTPVNLGEMVNSPLVEESPQLSMDGKLLLFARSLAGEGDLAASVRESLDEPFGAPVFLDHFNDSSINDTAPRISADGKAFYFLSRRGHPEGKLRLYVSVRKGMDSVK